jgi:hypothetical protein
MIHDGEQAMGDDGDVEGTRATRTMTSTLDRNGLIEWNGCHFVQTPSDLPLVVVVVVVWWTLLHTLTLHEQSIAVCCDHSRFICSNKFNS